MNRFSQQHQMRDLLTSYFWSGDTLRSRSVSNIVLTDTIDIPAPSARLLADWHRETSSHLLLEPGDVEVMPLARTQARWPDYTRCVQAMSDWTCALGMPLLLSSCDVALMASRGAKYHHDGAQYGSAAFCNLFLSEDQGLDLHFPFLDYRIPLTRGTAVIFDPSQAHGIIRRSSNGFDPADFAAEQNCTQQFLTWELPIKDTCIERALEIVFDIAASSSSPPDEEQVWLNGARASVCPDSGRWRRSDLPASLSTSLLNDQNRVI